MDASDEFRYIGAPKVSNEDEMNRGVGEGGVVRKKVGSLVVSDGLVTKEQKEYCDDDNEASGSSAGSSLENKGGKGRHENSRNVPVCVYNTNKNVKLRFVWDKAFKVFQSNKTVYKAVSGIHYQDFGTLVPTKLHEPSSVATEGSNLIGSTRFKSRSHSYLNALSFDEIEPLKEKANGVNRMGGSHKVKVRSSAGRDFPAGGAGDGEHGSSKKALYWTSSIKNMLSSNRKRGGAHNEPKMGDDEDKKSNEHVGTNHCYRKDKGHNGCEEGKEEFCCSAINVCCDGVYCEELGGSAGTTCCSKSCMISGGEKPQGEKDGRTKRINLNGSGNARLGDRKACNGSSPSPSSSCSNNNCSNKMWCASGSLGLNGLASSSAATRHCCCAEGNNENNNGRIVTRNNSLLRRNVGRKGMSKAGSTVSNSRGDFCSKSAVVDVKRSHSIRSHLSDDSLFQCSSSPQPPQRHISQAHLRATKFYYGDVGHVSSGASSPAYVEPYVGEPSLCDSSDCMSSGGNGADSGVDTWKDGNGEENSGSAIVCTISQRIPGERGGSVEPEGGFGVTQDKDCHLNLSKRTVVLLNAGENERTKGDDGNEEAGREETWTSYDVECMSEIDLNSDSGSEIFEERSNYSDVGLRGREKKGSNGLDNMKFVSSTDIAVRGSNGEDNELDSLDLSLFETKEGGRDGMAWMKRVGGFGCDSKAQMEYMYGYTSANENCQSCKMRFADVDSSNNDMSLSSNNSCHCSGNWDDAASEFEFLGPPSNPQNRDIPLGHHSRGNPPQVEWEPFFCVLNQLDQTFTSYRSEEMSIFPGTPTRPRTQNVFAENGISPTDLPHVRLDGGPNSIKCLINNSKWGMNPLLEEEEESVNMPSASGSEKDKSSVDYSTGGSNQKNSSTSISPHDTSYDKACGNDRRSSAPVTPLLGRETPSRFANFFSKRSFKSNPLKRTKSVTKLERKKLPGMENDSSSALSSRLRTSRSHESLLQWSTQNLQHLLSNGMMSTIDLTAGNVAIRALHPSVIGQDYSFQISTPCGSKYYSCSSAAERDSWVYALRQAIKPQLNEIRRQENSFKIWILEAKGAPGSGGKNSSKKFFCELYLDEILYARTAAKPKNDMLFWGEHFEFIQLPNCVQHITVILYREGDKKRKKERNTCLGKVRIPVSAVTGRYLIEKWYPVLPESSSSSNSIHSKEKEGGPSLRIKCKYQSIDILPLWCYQAFIQFIKNEYALLSECLEAVLSVKIKEDLANAMVHILHHEGLAKEFIAELALQEILKSGDERLTFRGNSIATKAMEAFLKLTGSEYLYATLGPFIESFQTSDCNCEVDPMKLAPGANLAKNQETLRLAIETVWSAILHSHENFPAELKECFSHCREALRSAGKEDLSDHLISASIFLRFLCPAILSPSLFNITNEYPSEKSARNLTLVAKVLQTLANFTRFQGKENYMEFINDFVEKEAPRMKEFLSRISSPMGEEALNKRQREMKGKAPAGGFIDLGKYLSILASLLGENVSKIASKNDRFKNLQEILDKIHSCLKHPGNPPNMSPFPFPHVASQPPSVPAPRAPVAYPINQRISSPMCEHHGAVNQHHQYQVPHAEHYQVPNGHTPIYAVANVFPNNCNPNVRNISQVQMNMNGHLQIPIGQRPSLPSYNQCMMSMQNGNGGNMGNGSGNNKNMRSGSQASSGYQSQSPVLEGEEKSSEKKQCDLQSKRHCLYSVPGKEFIQKNNVHSNTSPLISKSSMNRNRCGSQSVDDLSSLGINQVEDRHRKRRLARSSSSSDCEYGHGFISPVKFRARASQKQYSNGGKNTPSHVQNNNKNVVKVNHHRLSRRSSAELLRKSHAYSSSTDDDDSDLNGNINQFSEKVPKLPPRKSHLKRTQGQPSSEESGVGEKTTQHYEKEMLELRRAMEALQSKLSKAEERLFGRDNSRPKCLSGESLECMGESSISSSTKERLSRNFEENSKEMEHLLQRLLSAEEEMKREQDLLTALDQKQKLIDAQERKISRLDSVNNQLLGALSQIRDSLQQQQVQQHQQKIQQQVQQHQQKIQQQLQKQQQYLDNLSNGIIVPTPRKVQTNSNGYYANCGAFPMSGFSKGENNNAYNDKANNNGDDCSKKSGSTPYNNSVSSQSVQCQAQNASSMTNGMAKPSVGATNNILNNGKGNSNHNNNNTTKVIITSDGIAAPFDVNNYDSAHNQNRDSSAMLEDHALKLLAELRSSSC